MFLLTEVSPTGEFRKTAYPPGGFLMAAGGYCYLPSYHRKILPGAFRLAEFPISQDELHSLISRGAGTRPEMLPEKFPMVWILHHL
ncbi:MAG: hypothetical protein A4E35_01425 [Methanoregula sp. PtaU1.Bin051]|nr:MAG: hypothetical protein A4E35_01425 [Methanoregula sp. PtaU1.Bin051]